MAMTRQEAQEQLRFIEGMIRDGRQSMERWGWAFVLWGCGHLVAAAWSTLWAGWGRLPWVLTMGGCGAAMGVASLRIARTRGTPTSLGRTVGATWFAFGVTMVVLWVAGAAGGALGFPTPLLAVFFALMGGANFVTGVALRLRVQVAVGALWWLAGALVLLAPGLTGEVFVACAVGCEVAFGLYLMALRR